MESAPRGEDGARRRIRAQWLKWLSNFPIWWVGLLLGFMADRSGPKAMLLGEAALGVLGVLVFVASAWAVRRSKLVEST